MHIALCVFGVNGVGKSALLSSVVDESHLPVTVVRGSTILKKSLGVASYEVLENMPAIEKKQALLQGMMDIAKNPPSPITIVDTHLIVSIRSPNGRITEDMWDNRLASLYNGFIYITADAKLVAERRRQDRQRKLRVSMSSRRNCDEDLHDNTVHWNQVSTHMSQKCVIVNNQTVRIGARKIIEFIQTLTI